MNKISLDNVRVPKELSSVVDNSIERAKTSSRKSMLLRRPGVVAAVLVICVISLNFNAFAETAKQLFLAMQNSLMQNNSRIEAINNDYYSQPTDTGLKQSVTSGNTEYTISLNNYYIDENEVGFDFTLTGKNLDEKFGEYLDYVSVCNKKLTIKNSKLNEIQEWEEIFNPDTGFNSRIFPGGHYIDDPQNNKYEYVDGGIDSLNETAIKKISDNTYNMVDITGFGKPIIVGDKIEIHYGSLRLMKYGDVSKNLPDSLKYMDVDWNFSIDVDEKFAQSDNLSYKVSNPEIALEKGIGIVSFTVSPLVTKLSLAIDFTKNDIANPDNIKIVSEPQYVHKLDVMDLHSAIIVECNGEKILVQQSTITSQDGNTTYCTIEMDSIYFKNADSIDITINERSGNVIRLNFNKDNTFNATEPNPE